MELRILPLTKIVEDPDQPRRVMDDASLQGLADSIRQHGLLNPITVVSLEGVDAYRIVTGERRWRASQIAGLTEIPCIVAPPTPETAQRTTEQLIENLQREDLQPYDAAQAIRALKEALGATSREVAQRLGMSESAVAAKLALLDLPEAVAEQVVSSPNRPADGQVTEKHARFLRLLNDQPDLQAHLVEKIKGEKLSSEDTGRIAKAVRDHPEKAETILETGLDGLPSLLGRSDERPFSQGRAFVQILERVPRTLEEVRLDAVSAADLPAIEAQLLAVRAAVERLLAEVRAAQREG